MGSHPTLRTAAKWIHGHYPFPAGNPMERISDLNTPEPTWQELTDLQMVRMKAAADQLLTLSTGANQWPRRDYALFHVLYVTAMRVSELIQLEIDIQNLSIPRTVSIPKNAGTKLNSVQAVPNTGIDSTNERQSRREMEVITTIHRLGE